MSQINVNVSIQEAQWTPSKMNSEVHTGTRWIRPLKDKIFNKRKGTHHVKRILNKLLRDLSSQTLETRRQWAPYSKCYKEKTINQESYFWHTCSSEVREKLRHSQINKSWGSSLPLDVTLARNAEESPAGKNERTLNNVQPREEIKITVEVKTWAIYNLVLLEQWFQTPLFVFCVI